MRFLLPTVMGINYEMYFAFFALVHTYYRDATFKIFKFIQKQKLSKILTTFEGVPSLHNKSKLRINLLTIVVRCSLKSVSDEMILQNSIRFYSTSQGR